MPLSRQADNPRTPKFQCCAAQRPLQTWSRAGMDHLLMSLQVCGHLRLLNIEIGGAGGYPRAARWQFNFPLRSCSGPSRCAETRRNTCTDDCDNTLRLPCKCAERGAEDRVIQRASHKCGHFLARQVRRTPEALGARHFWKHARHRHLVHGSRGAPILWAQTLPELRRGLGRL